MKIIRNIVISNTEPENKEVGWIQILPNGSFEYKFWLDGDWFQINFGEKGKPGDSAYDLAVKLGFKGTITDWLETLKGPKGDIGDTGKGAYDYAVELGFEGTVEEWIQSLKGEKGEDGIDGKDGEPGTTIYSELEDKPSINNITLEGNKTLEELGIQEKGNYVTEIELSQNLDKKANKEDIPDVSSFITNTVNNLTNYYTKLETYTQSEVNNLIGSITTINFKVVDTLPEIGESNLIYLVPSITKSIQNIKDEYIWVDNNWESIGSTQVDLTNYYNKSEVDSKFALKTDLSSINFSDIQNKPTTLEDYGITDALSKSDLNNYTPESGNVKINGMFTVAGSDRSAVILSGGNGLAKIQLGDAIGQNESIAVIEGTWDSILDSLTVRANQFIWKGGTILTNRDIDPNNTVTTEALNNALAKYLPLTSGTLRNYLTINSGTNYVGLVLKNNYSGLTNIGGIHVGANNDLILRASKNGESDLGQGTDLRLRYDGNITWNGKTVWHAGNFNPDDKVTGSSENYMKTFHGLTDANSLYYNACGFGWNMANAPFTGDTLLLSVASRTNEYRHSMQLISNTDNSLYYRSRSQRNYAAGKENEGWRAWVKIYHSGNLGEATSSAAGLMSAADKTKLDGLASALSLTDNYPSAVTLNLESDSNTTENADEQIDSINNKLQSIRLMTKAIETFARNHPEYTEFSEWLNFIDLNK